MPFQIQQIALLTRLHNRRKPIALVTNHFVVRCLPRIISNFPRFARFALSKQCAFDKTAHYLETIGRDDLGEDSKVDGRDLNEVITIYCIYVYLWHIRLCAERLWVRQTLCASVYVCKQCSYNISINNIDLQVELICLGAIIHIMSMHLTLKYAVNTTST